MLVQVCSLLCVVFISCRNEHNVTLEHIAEKTLWYLLEHVELHSSLNEVTHPAETVLELK